MRKTFKKWLILVLIASCLGAMASEPGSCVTALEALVETHYDNPNVYCKGRCGLTVAKLLNTMRNEGWDLDKARVIYVLYERNKVSPVPALIERHEMRPIVSRENDRAWFYHSLIEYEGKIVDLHTGKQVTEPSSYFSRTFPNVANPDPAYELKDRLSELYMRWIPAKNYLEDFQDPEANFDQVADKYRSRELDEFPILSVRKYLETDR